MKTKQELFETQVVEEVDFSDSETQDTPKKQTFESFVAPTFSPIADSHSGPKFPLSLQGKKNYKPRFTKS
jgi:hypothetical protein